MGSPRTIFLNSAYSSAGQHSEYVHTLRFSVGGFVGLNVPTFFADNLLELTLDRIEGVAERNVDVLIMLAVGDDLGVPRARRLR